MDLNLLDSTTIADKGIELEIRHPKTAESTGLFVTILGSDSKAYKAQEKDLRKQMVAGTVIDDPEGLLAARTTIGWRGAEVDGKEVKFSEDTLLEWFKKAPTIRDQIINAQKVRALFMPAVSKS